MSRITSDEIAEILFEAIKNYYKGISQDPDNPEFRKALTPEEANELLRTCHNIIHTVRIEDRNERAANT
jgi:hypothetical protein